MKEVAYSCTNCGEINDALIEEDGSNVSNRHECGDCGDSYIIMYGTNSYSVLNVSARKRNGTQVANTAHHKSTSDDVEIECEVKTEVSIEVDDE